MLFASVEPAPRPPYVLEWMMPNYWPDSNVAALRSMCARLGVDPRDLVAVMANESGCLPDPPHRGPARGLIQFEPDTLRGLGWRSTPDDFAKQEVAIQLDYVERYYAPYARAGQLKGGIGPLYVATFLPALLPHAGNALYVLCGRHGPLQWAYDANKGFDRVRKGYIVVQDLVDAAVASLQHTPQALDLIHAIDEQEAPPPAVVPLVEEEPLDIPGETEPNEPDEKAG
jgi:hypothetical protein